jgi:SAM-dependent methyltransferase
VYGAKPPPERRPEGATSRFPDGADPLAPAAHATIEPAMPPDDRFDDLSQSLGGFYRSWVVYLGLQLGLFERIRASGGDGIAPADLASAVGCAAEPVDAWVRAAHASELIEHDGTRVRMDETAASVLLDDTRPEYLGGQFVAAVVSSLDYEGLADFFKTGRPIDERPARFHRAIEAVTVQDIAVFFQEGLAVLPDLAGRLASGARILDVACGGGKWLIAVATRFPATELVGVEFVPDSVARAMRHVTDAGLEKRIRIEARAIPEMPYTNEFDLVYMQDALHELPDPVASLRAAWKAVGTGGRLVVFEWCLPSTIEESQNLHAELLWGIQIDELFQGTRMYTHQGFDAMFAEAAVPPPTVAELPSGATLFVADRPTG